MKERAWIGIDPGRTGAAALIHQDGCIVADWPGCPAGAADLLTAWRFEYEIDLVALERVHAMPKQGVASTFTFGQNFGQWEGIIAALSLPCLQPTPQDWQKGLIRKSDGADAKARALSVARRLFPDADLSRKKDHGRADALLLAWWARRQGGGRHER
jgi:crossover junction endodeoxyribonuclease RuvC